MTGLRCLTLMTSTSTCRETGAQVDRHVNTTIIPHIQWWLCYLWCIFLLLKENIGEQKPSLKVCYFLYKRISSNYSVKCICTKKTETIEFPLTNCSHASFCIYLRYFISTGRHQTSQVWANSSHLPFWSRHGTFPRMHCKPRYLG